MSARPLFTAQLYITILVFLLIIWVAAGIGRWIWINTPVIWRSKSGGPVSIRRGVGFEQTGWLRLRIITCMPDEEETLARLKKASEALDVAKKASEATVREVTRAKNEVAKAKDAQDAAHASGKAKHKSKRTAKKHR